AADAEYGSPLRGTQPLPGGGEHPRRRGVSGVAEAEIPWGFAPDDRGVLRGRGSDLPARTQLLLTRCPGVRSTRVRMLPCTTNSAGFAGAEAEVEVMNEKRSSFQVVVAIVPDDGSQCTANDSRSAGSLQSDCRSPGHDDRAHGPLCNYDPRSGAGEF